MSRYRTPLKNVRGLGAAKTGTGHFVIQRLTATALVPLSVWFLIFLLSLVGADHAAASAAVAKPWNAILLVGPSAFSKLARTPGGSGSIRFGGFSILIGSIILPGHGVWRVRW